VNLPPITRGDLDRLAHSAPWLVLTCTDGGAWQCMAWARSDRLVRWIQRGMNAGDRAGVAVVVVSVAGGVIAHRNALATDAVVAL